MASTDTAFTGSVPQLYERHLGPLFFQPYADETARRFEGFAGDLLEVAAGTGIVTRALDRVLAPAGRIVATDLTPAMLAHAAAQGVSDRVSFGEADGQALPFEDASFDAVVCQFGAMFFPDRVAGYREARRVLRPDGIYHLAIWDDLSGNEVARLVHEAVTEALPEDPPGFLARAPYGHSDPRRIREELREAGLRAIAIETVERAGRAASAREAALGVCQGTPLRAEIADRGEDAIARATAAAEARLTARFGAGPIEAGQRAHIITARA